MLVVIWEGLKVGMLVLIGRVFVIWGKFNLVYFPEYVTITVGTSLYELPREGPHFTSFGTYRQYFGSRFPTTSFQTLRTIVLRFYLSTNWSRFRTLLLRLGFIQETLFGS